jgi:hypothetical protein
MFFRHYVYLIPQTLLIQGEHSMDFLISEQPFPRPITALSKQKYRTQHSVFLFGGGGGIRTLGTF